MKNKIHIMEFHSQMFYFIKRKNKYVSLSGMNSIRVIKHPRGHLGPDVGIKGHLQWWMKNLKAIRE